ncbi:MAG: copper amine oxidase N-terminal domain-containing protein, partial [Bacteroidota bacterium]
VSRPAITVAPLTQAVLAEYRGLAVPASRMLAMLPNSESGKLAADGRITAPGTQAAAVPIAVAKVRDIKIVFDGEVLSLRTAPETRKGISLAPLREIFEKTDGVLYWFPTERKVQAVNKNVNMKLTIGDPKVTVNGDTETLQVAPYLKQGRTMVPLQFIADVLDVKIAFDNGTGQILISSNQF